MKIESILIVDDDILMLEFLEEALKRRGCHVVTTQSADEAEKLFTSHSFDLILLDMKLKRASGLDLLLKIKDTLTIVITAYGSIDTAVTAMKRGAFHYLLKPFTPQMLYALIDKAEEQTGLLKENHLLRSDNSYAFLAKSPSMLRIQEQIPLIADSSASVFITGESGTGKEVVANAIHKASNRANRPFVKINCAAIPDTLVESEFFGHEKGAFTGADKKRMGRFELAHKGTLLLDEVTEIPPHLQSKLLRAIQEKEFERVGGSQAIKVDVRLISTSNRHLSKAIKNQELREDLFYRLNVIPIHLSPLRERKEDILPLAAHFITEFCKENHRTPFKLTQEAQEALLLYPWPGNVRELANLIERVTVLCKSQTITKEQLFVSSDLSKELKLPLGLTLEELEKRYLIETLQATNHDREEAARQLGISLTELIKRVE